jgi:hypothetical protein
MPPGTLLRLFQQIRRVRGTLDGVSVRATGDTVRIVLPEMIALYTHDEATQLAEDARQWPAGEAIEDLLP